MTIDQAQNLLGLIPGADLGMLGQTYADKKADLAVRFASAPTPGLKAKLEQQVKELDEAYRLLSHALIHPANLPRTGPSPVPPAPAQDPSSSIWEEKYKSLREVLEKEKRRNPPGEPASARPRTPKRLIDIGSFLASRAGGVRLMFGRVSAMRHTRPGALIALVAVLLLVS